MDIRDYDAYVDSRWLKGNTRAYTAIALGGEVGEVLNEVKKEMRNGEDRRYKILNELGDTLYYLTALAHDYGFSLANVIEANKEKLDERAKHGTIAGR